ncbi:MAG: GNAT family N-acetyltransferase [Candidatus Delongbacteria bacterium]|nr:GNAT family N-acetyltransferase [Candidatus Delongbacteria bacterium]
MKIIKYTDAEEFYNRVVSFLEEDEAVNNLALGILSSLKKNENAYGKIKPFLAIVENDGNIKLVMIMTPPYNLQILGNVSIEVINFTIDYLIRENIEIPGIIGRKELCEKFVGVWTNKTPIIHKVSMNQRIYKLEKVNKVQDSAGCFKIAEEKDSEILVKWLMEFNKYIGEDTDKDKAERQIINLINKKRAYLWVNEIPVTMVLAGRETKNGIIVSGVYTPEEFRRNGYATSCVAEVSKILLDEGYKFCTLYTDLSNPTSNRIYQKIGYEPIADSIMYNFKKNRR